MAAVLAARSQRPADGRVRVDAGDDAAVLADDTAITLDTLVEGVHWDARFAPEDVGFKAVAVSVSDLAATGARPAWAVLSLALPRADRAWVDGFAAGFAEACERWDVHLVGGDTVRTPGPAVVTVTMGGRCVGAPLRRDGARPGDDLWVTGRLGLAGAGWALPEPPPEALAAQRRPDPPLGFALDVASQGLATAALDLSDGLRRDLPRLCQASGVGAVVEPDALPGRELLGDDALAFQVSGGEDFQLLFTARPESALALRQLARAHGIFLTRIGRVVADGDARLATGAWPAPLWRHFPSGDRP